MSSRISWSTPTSWTNVFSTNVLTSVASNALVLGDVFSNLTQLDQFMDVELWFQNTTAPGTAGFVDLWLIGLSQDGTTYEDGNSSIIPNKPPIGSFLLRAVNSQQIVRINGLMIPPGSYRFLMRNRSGNAASASATQNTVYVHTYSPLAN